MFRAFLNFSHKLPTVSKVISNSFTNVPDVSKLKKKLKNWLFYTQKISLFIQKVWSLGKLNHVAIAVPNLEKAISFYKNVLNAKKVSETLVRKINILSKGLQSVLS